MTVSLFSRTQICVHLAAESLIACEVERGLWQPSKVTRKARFDYQGEDRPAAMEALADWLTDGTATRRSIMWIVGSTHAQYFVLPWSPALFDHGLRDAHARAHFERIYEREASTAAFGFGAASRGGSQLVSWVPAVLPLELAAHARRTGCELAGIKPTVLSVWERFRDVLETESGTLCIIDGDREALVLHDRQRIEEIVIKPRDRTPFAAALHAGVFRRFSPDSAQRPEDTLPGELQLPAHRGYAAARDGAYAFALCEAL